jgi:GrpB-like predicted nucleotidyltransferase (UPF0157 family)
VKLTRIEVVPHDLRWKEDFGTESGRVAAAIGENAIAIHHIGSTSVPGIYAKPVIDLLIEVRDITAVDDRSSEMESLGYEVMGELGIPGRGYFRKDNNDGIRTHQIHTFESGSPEIERHLAFRDYLTAHPEDAEHYSDLKRKLAREHPYSMDDYMDGKDGFIKEIERRAAPWRAS